MSRRLSRRRFLQVSAASGLGFWVSGPARGFGQEKSPNAKLNVACIGVGGRGRASVDGCRGETIVALCDVDRKRLEETGAKYPGARRYADFRKMLETEKAIEAVTVGTPDHLHAPASVMAMKLGKHVYCEKPLAHSIYEARLMAETAAKMKVVTQMGNQLHSTENVIRPAELLQAGILGAVREVHSWSDKFFAPGDRPKETPPVPDHLDWDLWLGPAPARPYHSAYVPFKWRGWWDFGTANLGDMACHIIDPIAWGLDLGAPSVIEGDGPAVHPESAPRWRIARYEFPARGARGPLKLTWYDGEKRPPADLHPGVTLPNQGSLVVGERGTMLLLHGNGFKLLPESRLADLKLPDPVHARPPSHDHHLDWIGAIKTGGRAGSHFAYAAALTQIPLLGNLAYRAGAKIEWDDAAGKARNAPEAERFIKREYRKGWAL